MSAEPVVLETVASQIRKLVAAGPDALPSQIPTSVVHEIVRRYVTEGYARIQREQVIAVEAVTRANLRSTSTPRRTSAEVESELYRKARRKAWALVLDEAFAVGNGDMPTWGEASADQHRVRIENQEALVAGVQADIALHGDALADLKRFGIERLADL